MNFTELSKWLMLGSFIPCLTNEAGSMPLCIFCWEGSLIYWEGVIRKGACGCVMYMYLKRSMENAQVVTDQCFVLRL